MKDFGSKTDRIIDYQAMIEKALRHRYFNTHGESLLEHFCAVFRLFVLKY